MSLNTVFNNEENVLALISEYSGVQESNNQPLKCALESIGFIGTMTSLEGREIDTNEFSLGSAFDDCFGPPVDSQTKAEKRPSSSPEAEAIKEILAEVTTDEVSHHLSEFVVENRSFLGEKAGSGKKTSLGTEIGAGGSSKVFRLYDNYILKVYKKDPKGTALVNGGYGAVAALEMKGERVLSPIGVLVMKPELKESKERLTFITTPQQLGAEDRQVAVISMRAIKKTTLSDHFSKLIKSGEHLNVSEIAKYGLQMIEAIQTCHKKGILHGDIKLENFFVNKADGGDLQLMDFGLAVPQKSKKAQAPSGTIVYQAPEALVSEGGGATEKSDLWTLGIMLYELLEGKRPVTKLPAKNMGLNANADLSWGQRPAKEFVITFANKRSGGSVKRLENLIRTLLRHDPKKRAGFETVAKSLKDLV